MTSIIPPNHANAIAPFSPLGRRSVSEEDTDLKRRGSTFKALEELADSAPGENRRSPDERAGEPGEYVRLSQRGLNRLNQQEVAPAEGQGGEHSQRLTVHSEPTYVAEVERSRARPAHQSEEEIRAELLRQQAQKLLQSLRALRAMSPEAPALNVEQDGAAQERAAKAHAEQRAAIQRQIELSRRLIDMGIDADPAPLGYRLSQRI